MNRRSPKFLVASALLLAACARSPPASPTLERHLRAELDALGRAVVDRDAPKIQRWVADDTFTQPDTIVSGKRDLLASIDPKSDFRYLERRVLEIHTRAYGGVRRRHFAVNGVSAPLVTSDALNRNVLFARVVTMPKPTFTPVVLCVIVSSSRTALTTELATPPAL